MAEAHPIELRQRLVEAHERGEGGYILLARRFCIGEATAKRWVWQFRRDGHVKPRKKGGGTPSSVSREELEAILARRPDGNAGEIARAGYFLHPHVPGCVTPPFGSRDAGH